MPPDDLPNVRALAQAQAKQSRQQASGGQGRTAVVQLVTGSQIVPRPVTWLWRRFLAAFKFHLLAGTAGTGKTTIALALAAEVTTGGKWPDGTRAPLGHVLMWSGEDDPEDTLLPRFLAQGGDPARIHFISGMTEDNRHRAFDPAVDMTALIAGARSIPDLKLLILDPIVNAVTGDSHKNSETRRGLRPVVEFAAATGCAVLGITHFSKATTGRDPLERVTGSLAFGALARIVLATAKPQEEGAKRRLVVAKSNLERDGGGFEYDLIERPLYGHDFGAQCVSWGELIDGTARALLDAVEEPSTRESPLARREAAAEFLMALLKDGPIRVHGLKDAAYAHGHSWATIRRAREHLRLAPVKLGVRSGWEWHAPGALNPDGGSRCSPEAQDAQDAHTKGVSTFAENEHLGDPQWEADI